MVYAFYSVRDILQAYGQGAQREEREAMAQATKRRQDWRPGPEFVETFTFRLTREQRASLFRIAQRERRSPGEIVREALGDYLARCGEAQAA